MAAVGDVGAIILAEALRPVFMNTNSDISSITLVDLSGYRDKYISV